MIIKDGEMRYELDLTDWFGHNFPEKEKKKIPWFKDQLWDYVKHSHKGIHYRILRMSWGIWNGYVYIPLGHPLHGKGFMEEDGEIDKLLVHGGITYNCLSDENDQSSDWIIDLIRITCMTMHHQIKSEVKKDIILQLNTIKHMPM